MLRCKVNCWVNTLVLKVKVPFCPPFLLVNWITASQCDLLSMTRWVLTVLCRGFDPGGSRRRSEGPGVWQQWCCRAQGTKRQPLLSDVSRAFFFSQHRPNVPQTIGTPTNTTPRAACAVREEQEHFTALPMWPQFTLTAHDKANAFRLCMLCCFLCSCLSLVCHCLLGIISSIKLRPVSSDASSVTKNSVPIKTNKTLTEVLTEISITINRLVTMKLCADIVVLMIYCKNFLFFPLGPASQGFHLSCEISKHLTDGLTYGS